MGTMEQMYRNFMRVPFNNAGTEQYNRQTGGKITRFGAPLSGNANSKILRGYPTGGMEGKLLPLIQGPYKIGGRRCKTKSRHGKGKLMDQFINPQRGFHTYPLVGSTVY